VKFRTTTAFAAARFHGVAGMSLIINFQRDKIEWEQRVYIYLLVLVRITTCASRRARNLYFLHIASHYLYKILVYVI